MWWLKAAATGVGLGMLWLALAAWLTRQDRRHWGKGSGW